MYDLGIADVVIEVNATQVLAPANDNNDYGVYCRVQPNGDGHAFLVSGNGYYTIRRIVDRAHEPLVERTPSDVINRGNATNHLGAVCDGTYLAFYVNGTLVAETYDDTYPSGGIALAAGSLESEPTEIHFDDLTVTAP